MPMMPVFVVLVPIKGILLAPNLFFEPVYGFLQVLEFVENMAADCGNSRGEWSHDLLIGGRHIVDVVKQAWKFCHEPLWW